LEEKEQEKGEMRFKKNNFLFEFFYISGLVIIQTASLLLQEHSKSILWSKFV